MKTKNNVQKTVLRFAAVVVSFVLISYTVSAQDFWKRFLENSSFGHLAMAMVETGSDMADAFSYDSDAMTMFWEAETENNLELEPWMMDDSNFGNFNFSIEEVSDETLELEPWMLNQKLFQTTTETDATLELEAWMVSDIVWSI